MYKYMPCICHVTEALLMSVLREDDHNVHSINIAKPFVSDDCYFRVVTILAIKMITHKPCSVLLHL